MLRFLARMISPPLRRGPSAVYASVALESRQLLAAVGNVPLGAVQWSVTRPRD